MIIRNNFVVILLYKAFKQSVLPKIRKTRRIYVPICYEGNVLWGLLV